ncbi:MAG: class I SAM-dependent rRNA methyltransferase [Flavobacterium sp.]|nr:MAG: class I SAM-dependent rRNA methyltransferase [Flavobacterium sp.]
MFNIALPDLHPQRLAVKLTAQGERSVRSGHPWIFSNSISKLNKEGKAGDLAIIFGSRSNDVIGVGLYDPSSPIRIKMLHTGGPITVNSTFFSERISAAYAIRIPLLKTKTNSYRLLFGENDGFPGLIADVYNKVLVVKLYSEIWLPYLKDIFPSLIRTAEVDCLVLRLNRKLESAELQGLNEGMVIHGELDQENVEFKEYGVRFSANVIKGHKTGYFLDHRHNRKRVGELAKGKDVLDVFSYAGGFSVHALQGGATSVTSVDISKQALEAAKLNAGLNTFKGTHHTMAGDAFDILDKMISEGKKFDLVVIDPPSFAKSANEITKAEKKYAQLARLGAFLVDRNGILVLASCSSRVTAESFFEINKRILDDTSRKYRVMEKTFHDLDHPVSFPEGAYLKTAYYQFK